METAIRGKIHDYAASSLEAGKRADFAVLSGNPLADPANMHKLSVKEALVLGQTRYRS